MPIAAARTTHRLQFRNSESLWRCFPVWESAFYFSAASYATVGYGDVVLPQMWRTLGPLESIIGVLMCGLSVSFLFAVVSRLIDREARASDTPIAHTGGKDMTVPMEKEEERS